MAVWVQPGARKSGVAGLYQQCLKIRLNAPAVDNKANKALVAFVAKLLNVKKSQVVLKAGFTNRKKLLTISEAAKPDWEAFVPGETSQ